LRGFRAARRKLGLDADADLEVAGDFTEEAGYLAAHRLMSLRRPPTAVFAANDAMAIGLLLGLAELGVAVPRTVAVGGFDDIPIARFASPPLTSVRAGYWCRVPDRSHIRWVLAEDEEPALAALARLAAAGELVLGEGTRFAGMFRACGLLIPVWDLPSDPPAAEWEAPMRDFAKRYAEAVASDAELTSAERRARQGLVGRQLTLR